MRTTFLLALLLILSRVPSGTAVARQEADHPTHQIHADHDQAQGHDDDDAEHRATEQQADHTEHGEADENHADHGHEETNEDHGDHGLQEEDAHEEGIVTLTDAGRAMADVQVATVQKRRIGWTMELPGEVGFNEDRMAHVTPRFGGIVREVKGRLGQYVREGEVLAVIENNETLSRYSVRAPISGTIIEKHATRGEFASEEADIFVVANLATVWINLDVYPRHLQNVSIGDRVIVAAVGLTEQDTGTISYIAPIFDRQTRSATARVVLRNRENRWRPGTFVSGTVRIESGEQIAAVTKEAVQVLDGKRCVFVPQGEGFKPLVVATGAEGAEFIQVLSGLQPGQAYVSSGAFEIKAAIVTSSLGGHAGHGH